MIDAVVDLYIELRHICEKYIGQLCNEDTLSAFESDANKVINEANAIFAHYNFKAVLSHKIDEETLTLVSSVEFIDTITGDFITDINKYLP